MLGPARRAGAALIADVLRGLVRCPICGRGVHYKHGAKPCYRCKGRDQPSRVQLAIEVFGFRRADLAQLVGVSLRVLNRAARGIPVSPRNAARIVEKLKLRPGDVIVGRRGAKAP